jgi:tetrahydromethanopterin S-methyltransferase subunit A
MLSGPFEAKLKFSPIIGHNTFTMESPFKEVHSEIQRGMRLSKCRKCGCMHGTLKNLKEALPTLKMKDADKLLKAVNKWIGELEPQEYACFKCKYCIPPEAMSILTSRFPSLASSTLTSCEFDVCSDSWPPVKGEYTIINRNAPVAVSTLASTGLEDALAGLRPRGLCLVGKTETENIGIDKLVKNVITNPSINFLIVAGMDSEGHRSGKTLISLWENGVDGDMRVVGSPGRRPVLKNITVEDVDAFRRQIQIDDQIGCEDIGLLSQRIRELSEKAVPRSKAVRKAVPLKMAFSKGAVAGSPVITEPQVIRAERMSPKSIRLDRAGYFVIIPSKKDRTITVEHYSYDNKLLRVIEGDNSRDIYLTIIKNNWVSDLSHAAYLGKELAKAELSIEKGFKYIQDGA